MVYIHDSGGHTVLRRLYHHFRTVVHQLVLESLVHVLNRNETSCYGALLVFQSDSSSFFRHSS